MNLLQIQDSLRGLSDQQLQTEMIQPSGQVPQYLVMTELQRRKEMRAEYAANPQPNTSIADEMQQEAAMGLAGIMQQQTWGQVGPPVSFSHGGMVRGYQTGGPVVSPSIEQILSGIINDPSLSPADKSRLMREVRMGQADYFPESLDEAVQNAAARNAMPDIPVSNVATPPVMSKPVTPPSDSNPWDRAMRKYGRTEPKPIDHMTWGEVGEGIKNWFGERTGVPEEFKGQLRGGYEGNYGPLVSEDTMWDVPTEPSPYFEETYEPTIAGKPGPRAPVSASPAAAKPTSLAQGGGGRATNQYSIKELLEAAYGSDAIAETKQTFGGLAEQLAAMRGQAGQQAEEDKWMGLAQMGLAMASGESPYFATNVGRGGLAGLESLAASKRAARQRQMDLFGAETALATATDAAQRGHAGVAAQLAGIAEQSEYHRQSIDVERRKVDALFAKAQSASYEDKVKMAGEISDFIEHLDKDVLPWAEGQELEELKTWRDGLVHEWERLTGTGNAVGGISNSLLQVLQEKKRREEAKGR